MLSRVADSIYWMNRYIERAENVARSIDVNLQLALDLPGGATEQWEPLVHSTGDQHIFEERFGEPSRENVVAFLTFDAGNPNSIFSCLRAARENARSVRESITSEMWEQINKFYLMIRASASAGWVLDSPHEFFTEIKMASHLYAGITDATMSHGEGWHFVRLGHLLERADKTSRILDAMCFVLLPGVTDIDAPIDDIQWSAVLKSASAFEMYRKRHGRIAPHQVTDFLMLDSEFPRSMHSCTVKAEESLHAISGSPISSFDNAAEERLSHLRSDLEDAQIQNIFSGGLHEFLVGFQASLNRIGDAIFDTYFYLPTVDRTELSRPGRTVTSRSPNE